MTNRQLKTNETRFRLNLVSPKVILALLKRACCKGRRIFLLFSSSFVIGYQFSQLSRPFSFCPLTIIFPVILFGFFLQSLGNAYIHDLAIQQVKNRVNVYRPYIVPEILLLGILCNTSNTSGPVSSGNPNTEK